MLAYILSIIWESSAALSKQCYSAYYCLGRSASTTETGFLLSATLKRAFEIARGSGAYKELSVRRCKRLQLHCLGKFVSVYLK